MTELLTDRDLFAERWAALAGSRSEPAALAGQRKKAWDLFAERRFPTIRDEAWRFTNLAPVARVAWSAAPAAAIDRDLLAPFLYDELHQVVVVDGRFAPELSRLGALPEGTVVGSLATAIAAGDPRVGEHLGRHLRRDHPLAALNTALFEDGVFVGLPERAVLERALQVLYVSTAGADPRMSFPRSLLSFGERSEATVVERFVQLEGGQSLTVPVTELFAGRSAVVEHYRLQEGFEGCAHLSEQEVVLSDRAVVSSHTVTLSGGLTRNDVHGVLAGEGVECTLNGLYLTEGRQHVDNQMLVEHQKPHGASHELYKGVLDGAGRAVFNGLIHVHPGAQKTDAKQTNRNLLLSPDALVNTNPQLLIYADDVKCTHGSTVGQLDEDAIFYLRSRGIGAEAARSLLTWAFASELVDGIRLAPLRRELEEFLIRRLPRGEVVRQAI